LGSSVPTLRFTCRAVYSTSDWLLPSIAIAKLISTSGPGQVCVFGLLRPATALSYATELTDSRPERLGSPIFDSSPTPHVAMHQQARRLVLRGARWSRRGMTYHHHCAEPLCRHGLCGSRPHHRDASSERCVCEVCRPPTP